MLLVIQNEECVPLGAYANLLRTHDVSHQILSLHTGATLPDASDVTALLVLGGTMGVHEADRYPWMIPLQQLMRDVADADRPLLGICLGGQLLAAALDGVVSANTCSERGICSIELTTAGQTDPLFTGLPTPLPVLQWHHDSFNLPPAALRLAASPICPVQAFRYRQAYGLQFHPEVDAAVVQAWCRDEVDAAILQNEFAAAQTLHGKHWQRLFRNFLQLSGLLPSSI